MITERRLHSRKTPTEFTFIQIEQEFGGRVLNYSREGLSFETSAPIGNDDLVHFWLSFRRLGQVDGVGRIAWLSEKKNLGGIAFVHLSRASRQKIDEWTGAVPEHEAENIGYSPKHEESPEEVVSEIMERVLAERRKSLAAPPHVSPAEDRKAAAQAEEVERTDVSRSASSAVVTPPALGALDLPATNLAAATGPGEVQPADTLTCSAAPAFAPTPEESVDSAYADRTATDGSRELDSSKGSNSSLSPVLTPITPETFDLWSMTGSGEPRPALNSPAPRALGATSSGGMAVEAEPIDSSASVDESGLRDDRDGSASPSLATATSIEQTDVSGNRDSLSEEKEVSVPLGQYLYVRRAQFLRGAVIGIGLSAVITISVFTFWKPAERRAMTADNRNQVSANSIVPSGNPVAVPAASAGLAEKSKGTAMSKKEFDNIPRGQSPVVRVGPAEEPSRVSGSVSDSNAAPASGQGSSDAPTNAVPRPSSFAQKNAATGNGFQPLFEPSQPGQFDGGTADAERWNGQPRVDVALGSTPWTFRRRNIHGTPPVGGEVRPVELIASVAPRYPEAARAQHISGEVVIDAIIDTQGNVRKPQIVSGPMPFRSAALNAVLVWKYKPALLDGKPTEVHEMITLKFRAP